MGVALAFSLHWPWGGGFFSCASTGGEDVLSKPTSPGSVVGDKALLGGDLGIEGVTHSVKG